MRIAVISSTVFPVGTGPSGLSGYGGLECVAWECARGLAEKGHEVALIAPLGSSCPGVNVIQCLPPGFGEEQAYGGCIWKNGNGEDTHWGGYWQALLEQDVVICHDWQKWAYLLKAEGRLKAPVLGVMHAPVNTMYGSMPPVEKPCIVCISDDQRSHLEAMFYPTKGRTCYNGVDTQFYQPLNIPRSDRFLFLARFSSIKGPDIAVEACKKAGVGLDLIGDTSITNEPALFQKCQEMADGKQIRIIGSVPRGETVWWYSQARAMLHPNQRFREPFGLAPVESMLCGAPVISFNNGAMRETVKHGATGLLVESVDELVSAIKTSWMQKIIQQDRDGCREWAMQFSLAAMVSRYEELCFEAKDGGW